MAATIIEKWNSRKVNASVESPTAEFLYFIFGTLDENEARALLEATFPPLYDFSLNVAAVGGFQLIFQTYSLTYLGNGCWDVTVSYGAKEPRGANILPYPQEQSIYGFEIGVQTVKRTQSLETVASYGVAATPSAIASLTIVNGGTGYTTPPLLTFSGGGGSGAAATTVLTAGVVTSLVFTSGGAGYTSAPSVTVSGGGGSGCQITAQVTAAGVAAPAPNCQQAIGVNGDSVEGVDVNIGTFNFSETWYFPKTTIDLGYIKGLFEVSLSPVNQAPFRGFLEGEVLFLGVTGSERDDQNFELTFRFSCSPSRNNLTVKLTPPGGGTPLTVTYGKKGWDYVWFRYGDFMDTVNLVKQPTAVYVERVYDESDFGQLGIGN